MSMSMLEGNWAIRKYIILDTKLERCIFATFLTSTTIQDNGKRESVVATTYHNDKW